MTKAGPVVRWYNDFVDAMPSQRGKFFAITGTTSGTGFAAAKAIVSKGGNVFCLNRPSDRAISSLAALSEVCRNGGTVVQIDCELQNFASVRYAVNAIKDRLGSRGLNVLMNNAGVMAQPAKATKDGYDVQMQINHLSHFLLTSLLIPSLEVAADHFGEARVVNQSSAARHHPVAPLDERYLQQLAGPGLGGNDDKARMKRYQQSKLANVAFTLALKDRLEDQGSNVKSIVAHPGLSMTSLAGGTGHTAFQVLTTLAAQSASDGALPLLAAAVSPDAASGDFYVPGHSGFISYMLSGGDTYVGPPKKLDWQARANKEATCTNPTAHQLLWVNSEKAIGQPFFNAL